jgi:hypothetical protein
VKNKFEALKAFQSWPREWQELCAEFWAENEEPDQQRFKVINLDVAKTPTTIRNSFECIDQGEMKPGALPSIGDSFPYDRTSEVRKQRAAAKKIVPNNRRDSAGFTLDELKYAKSGIELGVKPCLLAEDMAGRFQRTKKAFQNYISLVQRNGVDETTGRKKPHRSES